MPCKPTPSGDVAFSTITAGQRDIGVWVVALCLWLFGAVVTWSVTVHSQQARPRRRVKELRWANEILEAASAFFTAGLDRPLIRS